MLEGVVGSSCRRRVFIFGSIAFACAFLGSRNLANGQSCANPIACENTLVGNLQSEWDVAGSGDPTLQGFATDTSVNRGQTINFKVSTTALSYRIDIYRLGYYGGRGARKITSISPTPSQAQNQPQCLTDIATGLLDCGNWKLSSSWAVPSNAVSGVYIARLVRPDTGGASHIFFVVRDDAGNSDILFQNSDPTWQAYNTYGGASLYQGNGPGKGISAVGRAYKVSYNRPYNSRQIPEGVFVYEYPLIRWLEGNGYNVSYASGVDTDRRGSAALKLHKVFLSVGHDEYWSGGQRANVEAARAAGVNVSFFSGNEIFWKTRYENSIDGTNTPYRTLVCYKETHEDAKIDPTPAWTGTWRDPRFSPPADGGRPENALSGQIFSVNDWRYDPIRVSSQAGQLRFWRNTGFDNLADGLIGQLVPGVLGTEVDEALDNGFQPPGLLRMSSTTFTTNHYIQDYGSTYGPGLATHSLTLYRHSSGALVFGAGSLQWTWGLDSTHDVPGPTAQYKIDHPGPAPDIRLEQATLNLLADMGAQPTTLQSGLIPAAPSTDVLAPVSAILTPPLTVPPSTPLTIYGTATDLGGGRPAAVEVSIDGGATWHPASGAAAWSATFLTGAGPSMTIKSRATDDSGRVETPGPGVTIAVSSAYSYSSSTTLFTAQTTPALVDAADAQAIELGVRFQSDANGWITALRFYKSAANTGVHIGNLWASDGTLLGTVTFSGETASGWQQAQLPAPVPITAGTSYFASYHTDTGHYSEDVSYFAGRSVDRPPLHAPADGVGGANGVYIYGPSAFPSKAGQAINYWVDVVYAPSIIDATPPIVTSVSPIPGVANAFSSAPIKAQLSEGLTASTISSSTFILKDAQNNVVPASVSYDAVNRTIYLQPTQPLNGATTYTATIKGGLAGISDLAGNKLAADFVWSFATVAAPLGPFTLFTAQATPTLVDAADPQAIELGVRFQSDVSGWITGLRFYKSAANTGVHIGNLWASDGTLLATVTFTGETASGWQQAQLPTPVPIIAGLPYIASYHTNTGHYSEDVSYFAGRSVDRPPLHAPADSAGGANGVYSYGASAFPTTAEQSINYWVDVVLATPNQAAAPLFAPQGGTYSTPVLVTLSNAMPTAQIYYTTDGSTPTISSTRYIAPISVPSSTTIKAIAAVTGWTNSPISSVTYNIQGGQTASPIFTPSSGTYSVGQSVTISDVTPGATIYYTTDGSNPTTSSAPFTSAISVSTNTTLKAIAVAGGNTSAIASATYSFQAFPPTFTPPGGAYASAQSVKLSDGSPGAQIYYTLDGSTPTTSSTLYSGTNIAVNATATINAIAAVSGWANSSVAAATYTINQQSGSTPVLPGNLVATAISATQINLTWLDNSNNETGFKVERKTGAGGTYAQIATTAANTTSYSDASVAPSTNYYYRIRATNASGDSGYSNEVSATTPAAGALPPPWVDADIGSTGVAGSATYATGSFTVKGAGADIWGTADAFNYVYQPMTGNAEIVAKVNSVQNTDVWAKAGVMIRETLTAGSEQALMAITSANGAAFQRRVSTAGVSTHTAGASVTAPYWVRLTRQGNVLTGYVSTDGLSWTQVGTDTIAMVPTIYVGLAVTAHTTTALNQSVFSNVFLTTQPAAPSSLTATATSSSQVNLTWVDNATNESGFKIERKTGAGGTYAQIATVAAGVISYSDTGLTASTSYYYRVRCSNTAGDSAYSNEANVTTLSAGTPPAAPATLSATAISSSQINLSWADVSTETGFKIERKIGAGGTYAQIGTVGANVTTYSDSALAAATTYFYRVRATNAAGDSSYSPEASATTSATVPAAPASLTATAISSTQINLAWPDVSGETGFKIERKTGSGGTYAQIATVGSNVTSYGDTGLTPSTTYFYRVRATNAIGDSPYSPEASTTTLVSPPSAPASLTATVASSSQINLSWPDVTTETGFKIERKTGAGGTYAQIATTGANVTTYNNTGLSSSTTYYYRVRATNAGGDSPYSPEANATTSSSPPAFRSASSAGTSSATLTINKPTGTVSGDVMLATIAIRPNTATITASGWTLVRRMDNASGNGNSLAVYYKVAGASEPGSYSFTFSTSTGAAGGIATFIGIDTTNPVDVDAGQNTASSLSLASPSVTTRYANDMIVTSYAFASSATFTPPSGMTEAFDVASTSTGSTGESIESNYQLQSAIGATGTRTATASNDADTGNAHTLALKGR